MVLNRDAHAKLVRTERGKEGLATRNSFRETEKKTHSYNT